jgi:DHA1 family tetracycline resistance protein-like MFS transporter
MPGNKYTAAVGFIFVMLFIDVMSLGIIIPAVPKLLLEMEGTDISNASTYGGWLTFSYALTQFIFAPVIGNLSDRFGRRPVLLLSLLGFGFDYLLLSIAPNIIWLFIGRILAGVTGASITTATAYIADISPPEKKAQNFGMIGVAFGLGFIFGPGIGGLLTDLGVRMPFYVSAALCFLNVLYGYFVLPESLAPHLRRPFEWKRANPLGSFRHLTKYSVIAGLVASFLLIYISAQAVQSNWSYYTMEKFKWTPTQVGISLGVFGASVALVQGGLIRWVVPKLGYLRCIYIGLTCYAVGFLLFAFADKGWQMYSSTIVYCLGGIAPPSLQGFISTQISPSEQGELQGGLTSLMSAAAIIGPVIMTNIFSFFTGTGTPYYFPGAAFIVASTLTFISAALAFRNFKKHGIL